MANAFPFRLYGGATRPDAITGLSRGFMSAMTNLFNAAPPEVQRELGLNSAYRSPAVQQKLYDKSDKSGRNVAAPGKSRHQHGDAADLFGFGMTNDAVSDKTKTWVRDNAGNFGLVFPMAHEPWHIQLARSPGQAGPGASSTPPAGATPPTPAADVLSDALSSDQGLFNIDLGGVASKAAAGPAGQPVLDTAGDDAAVPAFESTSAAIDPRVFDQRWAAGAGQSLKQPADLANLFKVSELVGNATAPTRIPIRRF